MSKMKPWDMEGFWGRELHSAFLLTMLLSMGGDTDENNDEDATMSVDLGRVAGDPYTGHFLALWNSMQSKPQGCLRVTQTVQLDALLLAVACLPSHCMVRISEAMHTTAVERIMPTLLRNPEESFTVAHWYSLFLMDLILHESFVRLDGITPSDEEEDVG
jgi:hypothetical protein